MNKPAWIAWDEFSAKGECVRCGDTYEIGAHDLDRKLARDRAFEWFVAAHEKCRPDEAEHRARAKAREGLREKLLAMRVVTDDPRELAALLTSPEVQAHKDPVIAEHVSRAMMALSRVKALLGTSAGTGYTNLLDPASASRGAGVGHFGGVMPGYKGRPALPANADPRNLLGGERGKMPPIPADQKLALLAALEGMLPGALAGLAGFEQGKAIGADDPKASRRILNFKLTDARSFTGRMLFAYDCIRPVSGRVGRFYCEGNIDALGLVSVRLGDYMAYEGPIRPLLEFGGSLFRERQFECCPGMRCEVEIENPTLFPDHTVAKNVALVLDDAKDGRW
jgi:hypothetical protein